MGDDGLTEGPFPTPSHGMTPFGFDFDRRGYLIVSCWLVTTGPHVYVTNTGSGTISRYRIARDGTLTLVEAVAGTTGGAPIDMALSREGRFLYVVVNRTGMISAFEVEDDGSLTPIRRVRGTISPFAQGIVAW